MSSPLIPFIRKDSRAQRDDSFKKHSLDFYPYPTPFRDGIPWTLRERDRDKEAKESPLKSEIDLSDFALLGRLMESSGQGQYKKMANIVIPALSGNPKYVILKYRFPILIAQGVCFVGMTEVKNRRGLND